jgi:hypothetical protein
LTFEELKIVIADPDAFREQAFHVLRDVANAHALSAGDEVRQSEARELIIRCLERRGEMGDAREIHDTLLGSIGLYPYIEEPDELPLAERLAFEAHRPLVPLRAGFVFHAAQAEIYARLMDGENVILTAPTSFGKTLIVDALVVSGRYSNIVVVVPTIALIDEVRRRLSQLNAERGLDFKVITHPGQEQADRNIFVFTQERLLQERALPDLDLAVVDEFYKLSLDRDQDRSSLLNLALATLRRKATQLYLLGPSVGELRELSTFEHRYVPSHDSTVAVDVVHVERTDDEEADLVRVCANLTEPTLVYVTSPARAHLIAGWLVDAALGGDGLPAAAAWVGETFHPDWVLVSALRAGIGIHHGSIPRALGHFMVSAFNEGRLPFLVCTQTLIEGVNTSAKNIVVVDDTIDRRPLDLFSYRNIQGRSGRMFKHYVGRVFLFHPPPVDPLPTIDIPAVSQSEDASLTLLLGLEEEELTPRSLDRIGPLLNQELLSVEVLRDNGVDPEAQLRVAEEIDNDPRHWSQQLEWHGFPRYEQLLPATDMIWRHFPNARKGWGVRSAAQLSVVTLQMSNGLPLRELIENQLRYWRDQRKAPRTVDDVVLDVLKFSRSGLTFGLPKYLRVLDAIRKDVLGRHNLPTGSYRQFAAAAESSFMEPALAALDEYGVPLELAKRLRSLLVRHSGTTLDDVLGQLRNLDVSRVSRSSFELELLRDAQAGA